MSEILGMASVEERRAVKFGGHGLRPFVISLLYIRSIESEKGCMLGSTKTRPRLCVLSIVFA